MTNESMTTDAYEAEHTAQQQALNAELQALGQRDDPASLERRYELHTELIWHVWAMGTTRGQEQAEQAVAIARRLQDPQREAAALHDWARVYLAEHGDATGDDVHPTQEECQTGQRLHEAALQVREALLGPDHPDVAESLMEILGQGRFWWPMQPYMALAERAVAICERALGPEHERTCAALEKLALMLRLVSDYARSLAIYERLLAAYTRVFGPDDQNHTQNTISQLAWTQRALGNHAAAAALLRDQLAQQRRALGEHDPSVLSLIVQLSDALHQQGEAAAADAELAQTLALLETERGPDHPHTLAFLLQIAGAYYGRGDQAGARPIYERVVAAYQRTGVQGDIAFYVMTTLFTLRWQQGDRAGARELFAQLLANGLSPNNLLANLNALGALGDVGGDRTPAGGDGDLLALYAQLLAAIERKHGPDHPNAAAVLIGWAQQLMGEDDRAAAIPLLARALTIYPQALAAPDGALLGLLRSIDEALSEAGEYATVRALYRQTHDACAPALGAAHPRVRDLQVRLGLLPDVEPAPLLPEDEVSDALASADVVIFQSPAARAALGPLRAILSSAGLAAAAARTLGAAIDSTAELLILMLPDDRSVALTSDQITRLQSRKVIGIGYGAARLFAELGLEIQAGMCMHYGAMAMQLTVEPNQLAALPGQGDPAGVAQGDVPEGVDQIGLHIPRTSPLMQVVDVIARAQTDPNYALIARQGHHILIGVAAPPDAWTPAYADLFAALAQALHAYTAQPFARAVWETVGPGVYPLTLARGCSTTEASGYDAYLRFAQPTPFSATLTIAGSDNVMLLFMGEKREHWTREDGEDGETLSITVDITEADLRAVGDRSWHLRVVNFDREHPATCVLTITYDD